jgi:hypothetical protein
MGEVACVRFFSSFSCGGMRPFLFFFFFFCGRRFFLVIAEKRIVIDIMVNIPIV